MASNSNFNTIALKQTACAVNGNRIGVPKSAHSPHRNCPEEMVEKGTKRKADMSLAKQEIGAKRFALGNLTNAETTTGTTASTIGSVLKSKMTNFLSKPISSKAASEVGTKPTWKPNDQHFKKNKVPKIHGVPRIMTRAAMRKQQAGGTSQKIPQQEKPIALIKDKENVPSSSSGNGAENAALAHGQLRKADVVELQGKSKPLATTAVDNRVSSWKNVLRTRSVAIVAEAESTTQENTNCVEQKKSQSIVSNNNALSKRSELKPKRARASSEFEASDSSLYVTAVENFEDAVSTFSGTKADGAGEGEAQYKKPQPAVIVPAPTGRSHPAKPKRAGGRGSNEFEDNALYVTAVEHLDGGGGGTDGTSSTKANVAAAASQVAVPTISTATLDKKAKTRPGEDANEPWKMLIKENVALTRAATAEIGMPRKQPPAGIEDYDLCYWNDIYQVSEYAQDIFEYLQVREPSYTIPDYMGRQKHLTKRMRALLVDWMIEIQETFELNHETLYLAVKILDTYLSRVTIGHEVLQLVGIAGMLIASKYDERLPPTVDDFVYFCDGAYDRMDLLKMERTVFRTIEYDLGFPLSYRFLRRYARVNRIPMMTLTLARYILETGLMDYDTVLVRDSKLACAALFIARRMLDQPGWNDTLEHYSSYKMEQFRDAVVLLNNGMCSRQYSFDTVHKKYSHELFFEVAKRPIITNMEKLFATVNVSSEAPNTVVAVPSNSISAAKEPVAISTTTNTTSTVNK
ncbi:G2/mitotic-specific cyclin-B3 [Anopheles maculipalpis]|uniref:G2/mitotic-specific cyclin-B3 n=1 Tax=Anopheles maculipalpis TaxID=1496333 RepID=UPI002159ACAB|nr:G2/mitotic-specific cyclin-B3 [Anopheles maculipalpis]